MRFEDKVCVVTGGGSGIGRATCERFTAEGGKVCVVDLNEGHGAETVAAIEQAFSDLHVEEGRVRATLLHDPTVENLDVALYMDGSASMEDEYGPRGVLAKLGPVRNQVEPQMRWMLEYLATKDRDGVLRVAYWATGDGSQIEVVGDLSGAQAKDYKFPSPRYYGKGMVMLPGAARLRRAHPRRSR